MDMFKTHRENGGLVWRVGPMVDVLRSQYGIGISTSGYCDFKKRPPSGPAIRDARLKEHIAKIYEENCACYGVRKMWHKLLRDSEDVARCTVERPMKELGLQGAVRGKVKRTTIAGKNANTADDLAEREFWAPAPNRLWIADFTYVSTWEGRCCTAFVTDVFARRILGRLCSARMNGEMVAAAFRMAVHTRMREGHDNLSGLVRHNDKGSRYTADDFFELLALHGVRISIGSVGDPYDNALAETINGLYKTELIKSKGPWKTLEQLNIETARRVHWHNTKCISEYNDRNTPVEIEKIWYSDGMDARKGSSKSVK